jgi:hypothetical protein
VKFFLATEPSTQVHFAASSQTVRISSFPLDLNGSAIVVGAGRPSAGPRAAGAAGRANAELRVTGLSYEVVSRILPDINAANCLIWTQPTLVQEKPTSLMLPSFLRRLRLKVQWED